MWHGDNREKDVLLVIRFVCESKKGSGGCVCACVCACVCVFEWLSIFYSDGAAQLTPPGLSFPRSPFPSLSQSLSL